MLCCAVSVSVSICTSCVEPVWWSLRYVPSRHRLHRFAYRLGDRRRTSSPWTTDACAARSGVTWSRPSSNSSNGATRSTASCSKPRASRTPPRSWLRLIRFAPHLPCLFSARARFGWCTLLCWHERDLHAFVAVSLHLARVERVRGHPFYCTYYCSAWQSLGAAIILSL